MYTRTHIYKHAYTRERSTTTKAALPTCVEHLTNDVTFSHLLFGVCGINGNLKLSIVSLPFHTMSIYISNILILKFTSTVHPCLSDS